LWECCVTAFALEFSCLSCSPILSTVATQHTIRDRTILSPSELFSLIFSFGSSPHPCSCPAAPGVSIGTVTLCRGCVRGVTAGLDIGALRRQPSRSLSTLGWTCPSSSPAAVAGRSGRPCVWAGRCCQCVGVGAGLPVRAWLSAVTRALGLGGGGSVNLRFVPLSAMASTSRTT